jgi:alpha-galactosidase
MSAPAPFARHERAGSVAATRVAARLSEPTAVSLPGSAPLTGETRLVPGRLRCGALEVEIEVERSGATARLDARVRNAGEVPLGLEALVLGFRWQPPSVDALRFLRHGWQSWSESGARRLDPQGEPPFPSGPWLRALHHAVGVPGADREGWHESDLVTVVGTSPGDAALCVGALERGRAFGIVYLRRAGDAVEVELEQRLDAVLAAGETRELESVRLALGEDASLLLEEFAEEHGRLARARTARTFVSGWCSWYHYFGSVCEDDLRRNLEALAAARDELPVEVVQLDDGWQRAIGDWRETNAKFPSGLAGIAGAIRDAGFIAGLWTAPFCVVPGSATASRHGDWLLRGEEGPALALLHPDWSADGRVFALDPSRPEVRAWLTELFAALVEHGFQHLKIDFLHAACLEASAADPGMGRAERLRAGLEAIRRGAGEEALLLGCGAPLGAAVGHVDAMRIGPDVAPHWEPDSASAVPGIEATQPAAASAVRNALARVWMHRRLWLNDPDCLIARESAGLEAGEARCVAAAVATAGGVAMVSDDVAELSAERRSFARETLLAARHVDGLGLPGRARLLDPLATEPPLAVVAEDADRPVAALLNPGEKPVTGATALGALVGPPRALLGSKQGSFVDGDWEVALAARDAARVEALRAAPLVVFCDFDGTFSVQDVGSTLAQRHAGAGRPAAWARYERGEITAWQYNLEILDGLELPWEEVDRFLHTVDLDPGARDLLRWCEGHGVPFRIVSDGFDANLNRLQQIHGVRFAYDANFLRFDGGRWRLRAACPDSACGCGTGVCKRGRIEAGRRARPGARFVHIGNGRVSDLCGALAADVAFAKDSLADELDRLGTAFERFETLHDVIPRLETLLAGLPA